MTSSSYRPLFGFFLALTCTLLWGALPIFLTLALQSMNGETITFYRFLFAAVVVGITLVIQQSLPSVTQIRRSGLWLMLLAAFGLTLNYVLNLYGLMFIDPETVQVVTQLAPFLLMIGSIVIYKESFNLIEALGATVLFTGLLVFFNENLNRVFSTESDYSAGVWLIVLGSFAWALYALLQKRLLKVYSAKQLTFLIYGIGALCLLPLTSLEQLVSMNTLQLGALIFCCFNTVFAYGSFTEALNVWEASKVSAVIAATPIFTLLFMAFCVHYFPNIFVASDLNQWAYIGAVIVVIGSVLTAFRKRA